MITQVDPGDELDVCYDALDDRTVEKVIFFVDDSGNWYCQAHTYHGPYTSAVIFRVDDEGINETLLDILGVAREIGGRP